MMDFRTPRRLREIEEAEEDLVAKRWYDRHQMRADQIRNGKVKIVKKEPHPVQAGPNRPIERKIWVRAVACAKELEKKYGKKNLGPYTDFEWGELTGKMSAIRWVLGEEWDMLDT